MTTNRPGVRERLADAALRLFDERGYERTTIDDIADRAGVARATFFRHYRSKEDVIFPDHDQLLAQVGDRLASSTQATALAAVTDAVRLVLLHYVDEGEWARRRYRLTSSVAALRNREIASGARYQRLFREFIAGWIGDRPDAALQAEIMSAAVVAAHNHVLRRWLRGESAHPAEEVDEALGRVLALFPATRAGVPEDGSGTVVVAYRADQDLDQVLPALRELLDRS